ncbi:MAG: LytR/AlgR family response regulator transcription factor, partial [Cyclobacteriaceae bacterium]
MERVLIVEDESLAAEKLKLLLGRIDSRFCVMDVLTSVHEAVRWFTANEADLIFLDINLSDGISFEIFQQVQVETPIIFTTAFDQYAIRAFKHNAIDYLLKPATEEDLRLSLEKYRRRQLLPAHLRVNLQKVFSEYQATQAYRNRVLVSYGSKSKSIT